MTNTLTSVRDRPITVFFDADCGLCSASVRWLERRTAPNVTYRPATESADPEVAARSLDAVVVTVDGRVESGPPAIALVLSTGRGAWPAVGRAIVLPGVSRMADIVYPMIARNRSRISRILRLPAHCDLPQARR